MKKSYTDISEVLDDFSKSYGLLKQLRNDLTKALYGRLHITNDDEAREVALAVMTDADYVGKLTSAVSSGDPISAMHIYESCIEELNAMIESKKATVSKLNERISLQSEDSPEVAVAKKKRAMYADDIKILNERMRFCISRFYKLRRGMLKKILEYSGKMVGVFGSLGNELAATAIKDNPMPLSRLGNVDSVLMSWSDCNEKV